MIKNKLAKAVFGSTFLMTMIMPAIARAEEGGGAAAQTTLDPGAVAAKYIAAGASMCIAAMSAAYAQARIGAAGAGTLAERPEAGTTVIVLQALPEVIVLLGFVIAFMIGTAATK
jgi:V/A-type H+-transporting ATPase subunit K